MFGTMIPTHDIYNFFVVVFLWWSFFVVLNNFYKDHKDNR